MSDGSSLPSWLTFNPNELTFTGTPPRSAHGRLEILIRARDNVGNTADRTFNILIGRNTEDLVGLLKPNRHSPLHPPRHASDAGHGLRQATAALARAEVNLAHEKLVERSARAATQVPARAALFADLPPFGTQTGGFTAALHDAGPMAALGRARAWLDTLGDMARR